MNSNVINKYKCNICNDGYISETKCHLLVCQYGHLGKSILSEKRLKYNEDATAVRKHYHQQNHPADNYHLKLTKSLVILKLEPSLKMAKESMLLHLFENNS